MKKIFLLSVLLIMSYLAMAQLSKPILIKNGEEPIKIDKAKGLAHPAVYDWNKDGKKDLIVGEFERKAKFRVYLNIGTDDSPKFSDKWFYGCDTEGIPLSVQTG